MTKPKKKPIPDRVRAAEREVIAAIDRVVDPATGMTKKEYAELLDLLVGDLDARIEAVEAELKEEESC